MGVLNDANDLANIAADEKSLRRFVKSALDFALKYNLNGLNLYWRNLNWNIYGNLSSTKENILTLVKELSKNFKANNLLLTSAFADSTEDIYDYLAMSQYLDLIHLNKLQKIDDIIKLGVPSTKLIFEFNTKALSDRVGQFTIRDLGSFMDSFKVFLKYSEICDLLSNNKVISKMYDPNTEEMVANYIDSTTQEIHTIRYESTRTLADKTRRAMRLNLAGVSINSIDADDSEGKCKIEKDTFADFRSNSNVTLNIPIRRDATFPLLRSINQAIGLALNEMSETQKPSDNEVSSSWDRLLANFIDSL